MHNTVFFFVFEYENRDKEIKIKSPVYLHMH